ncbi:MAG: aminoacyl-histidine dipeptidase [Bacteroidales bacterium]
MRKNKLQPEIVWHFFDEITKVPRPSKKEGLIRAYLQEFASRYSLECRIDEIGNIILRKSATEGMELRPSVLLQCHMDMVCEKDAGVEHDFEKDPIDAYVDGDWVKARGTTLGADNGAGMAAALAVLASEDIPHGELEVLFTVDEETGLTGAAALQKGFFKSRLLLNLDGEEGIYVGCAGGIDTRATYNYERVEAPEQMFYFRVKVSGLNGGHSGDDINRGYANAVQLLSRFLWQIRAQYGLVLSEIGGGHLHNAIPREAWAWAGVPFREKEHLRIALNHFIYDVEQEYAKTEPCLRIDLESEDRPDFCIEPAVSDALIGALYACPNGVVAMSRELEGLVETSTNLASVRQGNDTITVVSSQRSAIESAKYDIAWRLEALFHLSGAAVTHGEGYPGWQPNLNSPLVRKATETYRDLFDEEPDIRAVHAGLECGLFLKKYPGLDMISFGPTILGAHSPQERLSVSSMQKFWLHLLEILRTI